MDIAVLLRLPLHELQGTDRRGAAVNIVAEKDEQIPLIVKRNLLPETFEPVCLPVHIADSKNPAEHPIAPSAINISIIS